jgi:hypothetical protein
MSAAKVEKENEKEKPPVPKPINLHPNPSPTVPKRQLPLLDVDITVVQSDEPICRKSLLIKSAMAAVAKENAKANE